MKPDVTTFDLPPHIMEQIIKGTNGVTAEVKYYKDVPAGHEVIVKDSNGIVLHTCPRPCMQITKFNLP